MWNFSAVFICSDFFRAYSLSIMFAIAPRVCFVSSLFWAYVYLVFLYNLCFLSISFIIHSPLTHVFLGAVEAMQLNTPLTAYLF